MLDQTLLACVFDLSVSVSERLTVRLICPLPNASALVFKNMSVEWKEKGNLPWLLSSSDSPDTARAAGRFESGGLVQTRKVFPAHEGLLIKLVQSLQGESQDF